MTSIFSPRKFVGEDLNALIGFLEAADNTAIIQEWDAEARKTLNQQSTPTQSLAAGDASYDIVSAGTMRPRSASVVSPPELSRDPFATQSWGAPPIEAPQQSMREFSSQLQRSNPRIAPYMLEVPADHPPITIPNIELSHYLGGGAFGKVFAGRVRSSGLLVAVKILQNPGECDASTAANEAVNAAKIRHPNVMRVFDLRPVGKFWVIVLEFVEGHDLAHKYLPQRELKRLFAQLADAVCHLHEHNIVHRDLKPANILLRGRQLSPVIVDLGMSLDLNLVDPQTAVVGGTPYCMPPEAFRRQVTPAFDAYTLGITAATVLLGGTIREFNLSVDQIAQAKTSGQFEEEILAAVSKHSQKDSQPFWLRWLNRAKADCVGSDWIAKLISSDHAVRLAALKIARAWMKA